MTSGLIENGSYPWIDPGYMGHLPEQVWANRWISPREPWSPERHWQMWQVLGHWGDQLASQGFVDSAWWAKGDLNADD